jgi:hypothetical protein
MRDRTTPNFRKKNWALYAGITSSITAKDNLEGHLFAAYTA